MAPKACIVTLIDSALTDVSHWLPNVIERLDHRLQRKRIGSLSPNHYGIVQFGLSHGSPRFVKPHAEILWVRAGQVGDALRGIGKYDVSAGHDAIQVVLDDLDFPSDCAPFLILVAGKRQATSLQLSTYDSIVHLLLTKNISLSLIGDTGFTVTLTQGGGVEAFGLDHRGISYVLSSSGQYATYELDVSTRSDRLACEIYRQYGMLALNTNGSVWDINVLESTGRAVAVDAIGDVISRDMIVSEETCQRCTCEDNGLGEPVILCLPQGNLQYCRCRSKIGGTVSIWVRSLIFLLCSANIVLQVETCRREDKLTFQLNVSAVAPFDCSTLS